MAKILFTWEIGAASGHITPYINLIKILEAQGHTVYFALRELSNAHALLKDTRAIYLQAPKLTTRPGDLVHPINCYPKILNNSGYARPTELAGGIKAWKNLFSLIQPDLLVFDFSPTAMLASRELPIKRLQIGTGFYSPPDTTPLTGFETLQNGVQDTNALMQFESAMFNKINTALTWLGMKPIDKFADIQAADKSIILSFKELDHYRDRTNADYLGVCKAPAGLIPDWPDAPGARIFMYLKPFPNLPQFLKLLNERGLPTLIYGDDIADAIKRKFSSSTLRFANKPLDMNSIGKTADVAVCNGNHGTIAELLLAGVPMLLVPLQAEQNISSINIEKMGAGLSAPKQHPESMMRKLNALINDPRYRQAAQAFAARYAGHNNDDLNARVLSSINALLAPQAVSKEIA